MPVNKAILVRFINECWNLRSRTVCNELLSPDYEHYMPGVEQPTIGPEAYQHMVDAFIESFPDIHFEIEDVFGEAEKVCLVYTARGTHRGADFAGKQAKEKKIILKGVAVARVVEGRILRVVSMFDNQSFLAQLETT